MDDISQSTPQEEFSSLKGDDEQSSGKERKDFTFHLTQAEVARRFDTTPRMLLYWESLDLIHPSLSKDPKSKAKRYTFDDLKEIGFVKSLLDEGYSTTALKEKLSKLPQPYHYDKNELLWDMKEKTWKGRDELAKEYLKNRVPEFLGHEDAMERLINFIFDLLEA